MNTVRPQRKRNASGSTARTQRERIVNTARIQRERSENAARHGARDVAQFQHEYIANSAQTQQIRSTYTVRTQRERSTKAAQKQHEHTTNYSVKISQSRFNTHHTTHLKIDGFRRVYHMLQGRKVQRGVSKPFSRGHVILEFARNESEGEVWSLGVRSFVPVLCRCVTCVMCVMLCYVIGMVMVVDVVVV
jgi:hypothetical protein